MMLHEKKFFNENIIYINMKKGEPISYKMHKECQVKKTNIKNQNLKRVKTFNPKLVQAHDKILKPVKKGG